MKKVVNTKFVLQLSINTFNAEEKLTVLSEIKLILTELWNNIIKKLDTVITVILKL